MSSRSSLGGRLRRATALSLPLVTLALGACRESQIPATPVVLVTSSFGASGCTSVNQPFTSALTEVTAVLSLSPESQICAARGGELLYATGAAGRVYEVLVDPVAGTATTNLILSPGEIASFYLALGITDPPVVSGLCVVDDSTLAVMEHTANVVLAIARDGSGVLAIFAGSANTTPGFADGFPGRMNLDEPGQVVATGSSPPDLLITDTGNDRIRIATAGALRTVSGTGSTSSLDGPISEATYNVPSGLTIACNNRILVTETNGARLREIVITSVRAGQLEGVVQTLAGGGSNAEGAGDDVLLLAPKAPYITAQGETYWVDSGSSAPIVEASLRRQSTDGVVSCPLWTDCDTPPPGWPLSRGATYSLAMTDSGALYILDADDEELYVVAP